jgi:hypothetical protein
MDIGAAEEFEKNLKNMNKGVLDILLRDETMERNIIFATDAYDAFGYSDTDEIIRDRIMKGGRCIIHPRFKKTAEEQAKRTKAKAEVFTPTWICCLMNNYADDEWFGRKEAFNKMQPDNTWKPTEHVDFDENGSRTWKDYVLSKRLEITCGEAPYLVSRYDTVTGESLPVIDRIGVLDRKIRAVSENTNTPREWMKWVKKAYQSTYGYEYQGDSLLIGRINLLFTFVENYEGKWGKQPSIQQIRAIAEIISWNLWQMDGLTGLTPLGSPYRQFEQISIFDVYDEIDSSPKSVPCRIKWDDEIITYNELGK